MGLSILLTRLSITSASTGLSHIRSGDVQRQQSSSQVLWSEIDSQIYDGDRIIKNAFDGTSRSESEVSVPLDLELVCFICFYHLIAPFNLRGDPPLH